MDSSPIVLRPLQWSGLPALQDAAGLDGEDLACLRELRQVLARHGKLNRFALHLAHKHFDLADDEILVEHPDADGRTQHVTVARRGDHPEAVPTTWLFGDVTPDAKELQLTTAVYCVCMPGSPHAGAACSAHGKSSSPGPRKIEQDRLSERNHQREKARQERGWPVAGHDRDDERER